MNTDRTYRYQDPLGNWQTLGKDELDAVEITGRQSWQDYAAEKDRRPIRQMLYFTREVMDERPGVTGPGELSRQAEAIRIMYRSGERMAHWEDATRCPAMTKGLWGPCVMSAFRFVKQERRCSYCEKELERA